MIEGNCREEQKKYSSCILQVVQVVINFNFGKEKKINLGIKKSLLEVIAMVWNRLPYERRVNKGEILKHKLDKISLFLSFVVCNEKHFERFCLDISQTLEFSEFLNWLQYLVLS